MRSVAHDPIESFCAGLLSLEVMARGEKGASGEAFSARILLACAFEDQWGAAKSFQKAQSGRSLDNPEVYAIALCANSLWHKARKTALEVASEFSSQKLAPLNGMKLVGFEENKVFPKQARTMAPQGFVNLTMAFNARRWDQRLWKPSEEAPEEHQEEAFRFLGSWANALSKAAPKWGCAISPVAFGEVWSGSNCQGDEKIHWTIGPRENPKGNAGGWNQEKESAMQEEMIRGTLPFVGAGTKAQELRL